MKVMELYKSLNIPEDEYLEIKRRLGRTPNDLEVYLFSAMWSEHCGYKHSRKYLSRFPQGGAVCSGENAGGNQIGDHVIVYKVESHNHPSAVEPFQGAATGIGGIIRDILAIGARPIALLDSLKFGKITEPVSKHLFEGVVNGISAYGNSIGVPTVAGEVAFDESYQDSPLVNVMAVGIVEKSKVRSAVAIPGNIIVAVGSGTGRDGIHGASFASKELSENSKEDRPSVQIGDPFTKKVLIEATLEILEIEEVMSCQDFGAAGLLSSSSEMAFKGKCGVELHLDKVHLREQDMQPWEIMLSESQERMLFMVKPSGLQKVLNVAKKYDMPASVIGETVEEKVYRLFWENKEVACVPPEDLCEGPIYTMPEEEPEYISDYRSKKLNNSQKIEKSILEMLKDPNFASKKWVYRQYDHTVGTRTSLKPGEAGSAGLWIFEDGGVLGITIDSDPRKVFLDPYNGAKTTVWEASRNLVSCGFKPLGITNCLNYGNPEKNEVSYQFIKSVDGIADACKDLGIPVVSGNVSFYNESPERRVYPTPTIGMIGYAESPSSIISNNFNANEAVFLIGKEIKDNSNVGGSLYHRALYDFIGEKVDAVDSQLEKLLQNAIFELRDKKILSACVDVSEGGLFGALFEALKNNNIGFKGNLINIQDQEKALFGEINSRYLISTSKSDELISYLDSNKVPFVKLGYTCGNTIEFNSISLDMKELLSQYNNSIELEMET